MMTYTKLAADGPDLPAGAAGHQAVRIEHSMLVLPIIVTAMKAPEEMTWAAAKKWAESLTINGWSWRLPTVEEAMFIPDRSKYPAIDKNFFPDFEGYEWDLDVDRRCRRSLGLRVGRLSALRLCQPLLPVEPLQRSRGPRRSAIELWLKGRNHDMNALARDIRKLLADRIQNAPAADLFAIATSICANDEAGLTPGKPVKPLARVSDLPRFTKYDLHGAVVPSGGVAVYDAETDLTWTGAPLECGSVPWKDALKACSNHRLFGKEDWRAPTLKERISIVDYSKFGPALYTEFSGGGASYEWTSTPDAESPSGCAWFVDLRYGGVDRYGRAYHGSVRAVRAGQPLSLGL